MKFRLFMMTGEGTEIAVKAMQIPGVFYYLVKDILPFQFCIHLD